MAGRWWHQLRRWRLRSGRSGGVVVAVACGEVADEEALDAGRADGEGLDVLAQAGQIAADVGGVRTNVSSKDLYSCVKFLPEALDIGTNPRAKASEVGSEILTEALGPRPDFGAKGANVMTRLVPLHH